MEKTLCSAQPIASINSLDTHFADMQFVRYEQKLSYYRRLQDVIGASMEMTEGEPELRDWCFDKSYTNIYLIRGCTYQTRALQFKIRQITAV